MSRRRHLTPSPGIPAAGAPPARRAGGTRQEATERVRFVQGERELSGWALNTSRGGLRAIVEDPVELGEEFAISVGDAEELRPARIVWIQQEPDGAIVGLSYLDEDRAGSASPGPGSAAGSSGEGGTSGPGSSPPASTPPATKPSEE